MTGSIVAQIQVLFRKSGIICTGAKRHAVKALLRATGARTSQEIAAKCPITSYATLDKYREIAILFASYIKTDFKRWDVEKTTADDIRFYLESVIDAGVALRTFKTYAAGLGKLETVLSMYAAKFNTGMTYDFRHTIDKLRAIARDELDIKRETREYADPKVLIKSISDPSFRVTAGVQYEGGARIREAALVRGFQLRGMRIDNITEREVGTIFLPSVSTKGGREREIFVSRNVYIHLCRLIEVNSCELKIDHDKYRHELKKAAAATSQRYTGSHGLRHSFAQRRLEECLAHGMGEVVAKLKVAHEMGHSRPSITESYLKNKLK